MMAAAQRYEDEAEAAVSAVRSVRRRELLRIAAADLLNVTDGLDATAEALTSVTRATIQAALAVAVNKVSAELRQPLPTRFAVIAMGRFGGHECGYGSDADVLFVHDPVPGQAERDASDAAHAVAVELRRLLALPVPDPPLAVDADLRPDGRQGPLVRTLAAYRSYYRGRSAPWEAQALLRAEAAAGDEDLGARFIRMIAEFRYPLGGLDPVAVREIRRIKARVEAERIPRGADRALHVKLGPGGLSDVEWTIQLLQLQHAHAVPALRTTRTTEAMAAAVRGRPAARRRRGRAHGRLAAGRPDQERDRPGPRPARRHAADQDRRADHGGPPARLPARRRRAGARAGLAPRRPPRPRHHGAPLLRLIPPVLRHPGGMTATCIVLNGPSCSGKSSIAAVLRELWPQTPSGDGP